MGPEDIKDIAAAYYAGETTVTYAGQATGALRDRRPAADITTDLGTRAQELLTRWSS